MRMTARLKGSITSVRDRLAATVATIRMDW
jgi:hypothetical protein